MSGDAYDPAAPMPTTPQLGAFVYRLEWGAGHNGAMLPGSGRWFCAESYGDLVIQRDEMTRVAPCRIASRNG